MSSSSKKSDLGMRIPEIEIMDREKCRGAWEAAFKSKPPKYASVQFMQRLLIHHAQCLALGGYSAATKRAMRSFLAPASADGVSKPASPAATLIREWNGRMYRVEAVSDHYVLDGKPFKSLSAVALHITGAKWSGPRFFGLTAKRNA